MLVLFCMLHVLLADKRTAANSTTQDVTLVHINISKVSKRWRRRQLEVADSDAGLQSSISLSNFYNNEYVGILGVGTPVQYLTVVFDTGSSDIWFPSSECDTCSSSKLFDSSLSSTYRADNNHGTTTKFLIGYGSGNVVGNVAYEAITLGELILPTVKLGEVTKEDSSIAGFDMDGICGLAFSNLAIVTTPSLIDVLYSNYPKMNKTFSMYLNSDPLDEERTSQLTFGGYDLSIVSPTATFFYTPVVRYSNALTYWTVSMVGFAVGYNPSSSDATAKFALSLCDYGESCVAIIDSGTSGIAIPTEYYRDVLQYTTQGLDCQENVCVGVSSDSFPKLLISLAPDNSFPLLPSDYVECSEYSKCAVKFQESSKFWILGDVFMQAYYTEFDVENLRIGFACDSSCSGGSWHGTGGYYVDVYEVPAWKRAFIIYLMFVLLATITVVSMNSVWKHCGEVGMGSPYLLQNKKKKNRREKAAVQGALVNKYSQQYKHAYQPVNTSPVLKSLDEDNGAGVEQGEVEEFDLGMEYVSVMGELDDEITNESSFLIRASPTTAYSNYCSTADPTTADCKNEYDSLL